MIAAVTSVVATPTAAIAFMAYGRTIAATWRGVMRVAGWVVGLIERTEPLIAHTANWAVTGFDDWRVLVVVGSHAVLFNQIWVFELPVP